ncbi:MAG: hypothetical protein ABIP48_25250 [Planctomycetota bacterium]
MTPDRVAEEFERVRSTLFSDWDAERSWSIRTAKLAVLHSGECEHKSKTITLNSNLNEAAEIFVTTVHEIAHAIAGPGHEEEWRRILRDAVEKAPSFFNEDFIHHLKKERRYNEPSQKDFIKWAKTALKEKPYLRYEEFIKLMSKLLGVPPNRIKSAHPKLAAKFASLQRDTIRRHESP